MDRLSRVRAVAVGKTGEEAVALVEFTGSDDYSHQEAWYHERRVFSMKTHLGDESESWNEITLSALACLSSLDSREAIVAAFLTFDVVSSKDLKDLNGEWFPSFIEDLRKKAELGEPLIHPWTSKRYWICFE